MTWHDDAWRVAGMPDGDYGDDLNEADAAWAEMYGQDGGGGGGGGGTFDMGNMGAALPAAPNTRLSPELTQFLSGLTCSRACVQHALSIMAFVPLQSDVACVALFTCVWHS